MQNFMKSLLITFTTEDIQLRIFNSNLQFANLHGLDIVNLCRSDQKVGLDALWYKIQDYAAAVYISLANYWVTI